jgi:hypothetical protein
VDFCWNSTVHETVHERVVFSLLGLAFERKQIPLYNVVGVVKNFFYFFETPVLLRAESGVKGGPTIFVGPFIADP